MVFRSVLLSIAALLALGRVGVPLRRLGLPDDRARGCDGRDTRRNRNVETLDVFRAGGAAVGVIGVAVKLSKNKSQLSSQT